MSDSNSKVYQAVAMAAFASSAYMLYKINELEKQVETQN